MSAFVTPQAFALRVDAMNYVTTQGLLAFRAGEDPGRMLKRSPEHDWEFMIVRRWVVGYALNFNARTPEA